MTFRELAASLGLAALSGLGFLATRSPSPPAASPRSFDYHQEVFFAVLEGLYVDGVPNEAVDVLLATEDGRPAHFVQGCPICMPAIDALTVYRARPPFADKAHTDTFGDGLSEPVLRELRSPDRARRLKVVTKLVERWVERRITAYRLTERERADWKDAMAERRKKGMAILFADRQRNIDMERCAFCDGANDACGS